MIDLKLTHVRPRRAHSANFELTLARGAASKYKQGSEGLSADQKRLVRAPLGDKLWFCLFIGGIIALMALQIV